jgi:glycine dehydrogenase subunit 1
MRRFIPNSDADRSAMLEAIGLKDSDELFAHIPGKLRFQGTLEIPGPLSEPELTCRMARLAEANTAIRPADAFLGAGAYAHYIPAALDGIISRSEFLSAYTPYQAEISQGTLQAIFEFQTMICQLTGMDVANGSLYDGATAVAEAVLMSLRVNRNRRRVVAAGSLNPLYRDVMRTYLSNLEIQLDEVPFGIDGTVDPGSLAGQLEDASCLVLQHPNFFGRLENVAGLAAVAHEQGAHLVAAVSEPVSLGLLTPLGDQGVDLAAGNGASFGSPLSFGGPGLGFIACRQSMVRSLPGRLAGQTVDQDGRTAYVLTLSTREQHIRRAKATSNICTNQALCATAATVFMSLMGQDGARELARQNALKAHYARGRLCAIPGVVDLFPGPCFNEFVLRLPGDPVRLAEALLEEKILAGLPLGGYYPDLADAMLFCVTEVNSRESIDRLTGNLEGVL